jgi:hypothetical protein
MRLPHLSRFSTGGNHEPRQINSREDGWVRGAHPSKSAKGGAAIVWLCRRDRRTELSQALVPSPRDLVPICLAAIAALKRRSSTSLHAARWHADPTAHAGILVATSDATDNPVEERPFKGRVASIGSETAFRPCVPLRRFALSKGWDWTRRLHRGAPGSSCGAIAALKRRSSTSLHAPRWRADPTAYAGILVATSDVADNAVEERPFKGRVAGPQIEPAFRPCVPSWNSPQRFVTSLTDNALPFL